MYQSLKKHCPDFHLYIFPFDLVSHEIVIQLKLDHVTVIPMAEFETEELLRVKPTRTRGEYCWTCTPSIIHHCLTNFNLPDCTYLDADLFFFSDPQVLLDELANDSVLITEHRYTPEYDQSETSGIYCVQFITFRNDESGMTVLKWWRDRCIEWCFSRMEEGKFGDQKYLDDWTTRFKKVHVLQHLGGGVAPWNVQQYTLEVGASGFRVADKNNKSVPLVFYHFHWIRFLRNYKADLGYYDLDFPNVEPMYWNYLKCVLQMDQELEKRFHFRLKVGWGSFAKECWRVLTNIRRKINGSYNVINLKALTISG